MWTCKRNEPFFGYVLLLQHGALVEITCPSPNASEWLWSRSRAASSRILDGIPSGESCEVSEKHSAYARSLAPKSCPYSGQLAHSQRNFYSSPFAPPHGQACVAHIRRKTQPVAPPSPPTPLPIPRALCFYFKAKEDQYLGVPGTGPGVPGTGPGVPGTSPGVGASVKQLVSGGRVVGT